MIATGAAFILHWTGTLKTICPIFAGTSLHHVMVRLSDLDHLPNVMPLVIIKPRLTVLKARTKPLSNWGSKMADKVLCETDDRTLYTVSPKHFNQNATTQCSVVTVYII